jgi:hypothetical protein
MQDEKNKDTLVNAWVDFLAKAGGKNSLFASLDSAPLPTNEESRGFFESQGNQTRRKNPPRIRRRRRSRSR